MGHLFETDLADRTWGEFPADGYAAPAPGAIFRASDPPCCGMPLGGISTGCVDLDARGVFGWNTIFNPVTKIHSEEQGREIGGNGPGTRRAPRIQPLLGLSAGGRTWALTTAPMVTGDAIPWCTEPMLLEMHGKIAVPRTAATVRIDDVETARDIRYWGHYPIADLEYETDAPVGVGLRAWSPFIPGDAAASNTPAAVFEVRLRNETASEQAGTLAISFEGPDAGDVRSAAVMRRPVRESLHGVWVCAGEGVEYVLAAIGCPEARTGLGLHTSPGAWARIARELPQATCRQPAADPHAFETAGVGAPPTSASIAVDFVLRPGAETTVRFVLAWYAPTWQGATHNFEGREAADAGSTRARWIGAEGAGETHWYRHMYATRYGSALEVARRIAADHAGLLERIIAWQSTLYAERALPAWLRDALVNNLCLITEDSYWAQPMEPLGDWVHPGGGFVMNECPRGCQQSSCIPCDWYGNHPIVFFFPDLARQNLRLFQAYQLETGEIPFAIGHIGDLPDMAKPSYFWQVSLNGVCYIDMVDRLWQRTGRDEDLREFYGSVKRANTFTMGLCGGPEGPISMPEIGGMEWFEYGEWAGMAAHMGGLRLAALRMVHRMAGAVGDTAYAAQCAAWLAAGSHAMEEDMWADGSYLNFWEKSTGKRSDDVMAYQLDGEWTARYHGLPGVFDPDRVREALETIRRCNVALTPECGAANFARPQGAALDAGADVARYGRFAMFPPEVFILAMTYIQAGEARFGIEFCRKFLQSVALRHGHMWDMPNIVSGDDGHRVFGTDYYQNMMLWALPAAILGQDIRAYTQPGGLIARITEAGAAPLRFPGA